VAVLEKQGKNKYFLKHFGSSALPEASIIDDDVQRPEEVIHGIVQAIEKSGTKSKLVCFGMFGPNTVVKKITVPDGSENEVEDQILWEAEQYIPFGADDAEITFQLTGVNDAGGKEAIVVASKVDVTNNFIKLIKETGYIVKVVDLNVLALTNIFEVIMGDEAQERYSDGTIIIDFGAASTKVIVYRKESPIMTKEINIGGVAVTEEIQRQLGVSFQEAEDLKCNGDQAGNIPEDLLAILDIHFENLMGEIKKVLNFYILAGSAEKANYCFITGGSAQLPGLKDILKDAIEMEILVLNPFESITYDTKKLRPEIIDSLSFTLPVAMGLALRQDS
jgi:type IV pilus assembly protein PilM